MRDFGRTGPNAGQERRMGHVAFGSAPARLQNVQVPDGLNPANRVRTGRGSLGLCRIRYRVLSRTNA